MKLAYVALAALAGACFSPSFQEGSPCSPEMTCPGDQTCIMGSCFVSKTTEECTGLVTISKTSELACPNRDTILTASAGRNYQWSNGETARSIRTRAAGTYRVAVDGCMSEELTLVDQTPVITVSGPTQICSVHGQTTTLTADEHDTYLWSTGETTRSITVSQPGAYTVTSGCFTSAPTMIAGPTPATITAECVGTRLTLRANAARSYSWSNGATTQTTQPTSAGPVTVKIDGCSTSPAYIVALEDALIPPVTIPYTGLVASFQVPTCVSSITIEARGAQGGSPTGSAGGKGASEVGTFAVTPGEPLRVVVGGQGTTNTGCHSGTGGGGGGSFVWRPGDTALPLLAAGGGGGGSTATPNACAASAAGRDGQAATPTGLALAGHQLNAGRGGAAGDNGTGGAPGTGSPTNAAGAGGGGWLGAGGNSAQGGQGGAAGAGAGGTFAGGTGQGGAQGGFGSGGAPNCSGGGGGGFSGGGAGEGSFNGSGPVWTYCGAGGGGSLNRGTSPTSTAGLQTGNGVVILNW
jgi:hypothetical protein